MKHNLAWDGKSESYHEYLQRAQREYAAQKAAERPAGIQGLPTDSDERKKLPVATGVVDYFPDAFVALAELSRIGNDKHNPGMPLHWSRGKSDDHPDALMRHFIERGKMDVNGVRHSAQVAWRALAILQLELEKAAIDAMEENAWRLEGGQGEEFPYAKARAKESEKHCQAGDGTWRYGAAVRARHWPEIPEDAVNLPCDVEESTEPSFYPSLHGVAL